MKKVALILLLCCFLTGISFSQSKPDANEDASGFWQITNTRLLPVYGPLAEYIVNKYNLAEKASIGIDLGSGPGNLIIELCRRTKQMFWINADINPAFFPLFLDSAKKNLLEKRVDTVFADAQALPFKDNYADIIVSRGSFQFWKDKRLAFSEIYRVLKTGGIAFIGRGFSENLPVEIAKNIRERTDGGPRYDVVGTAEELRQIMKILSINEYKIQMPKPPDSEGINYGIWLEFYKSGNSK